ncbi:MAG: hypothetical protein WD577_09405 [Bacteroidales bacterium]
MSILALQAQNTCTEQLRIAQRSFDDGQLDGIPTMLSDCMKSGFTNEEKANAYKLLIQTYLFSEKIQEADEVMMQFLSEFPSYSIAVNDPKEFISLYNTYRTTPIFKLEVLGGLRLGFPFVSEDFSASPGNSDIPEYFMGAGFGLEANYINIITGNFSYSAGLSFTYLSTGYWDEPYYYSTIEATFWNMYTGIPLSIRYDYDFRGLNLFAIAGIEPVYLVNSRMDFTRTDNIIGREPITGVENLTFYHRKMDVRPFFGAGIYVNLGRDQLTASINYKFSTINQIDENNYLSNWTLNEKYLAIEDELFINQLSFSISYIRPIYNPKKIR